MRCGISQALFEVILPQVKYPNPDQLQKIQAALDEQFPPKPGYHHKILTNPSVSATVVGGKVIFSAHFFLNVQGGGDWVIDRILPTIGSHFQGPFAFFPRLDKPIIAIKNIFSLDWWICLLEEKEAQEKQAMELIEKEKERVKKAFCEATIINQTNVPTA